MGATKAGTEKLKESFCPKSGRAKQPAKKQAKAEPLTYVFRPEKERVAWLIGTGLSCRKAAKEPRYHRYGSPLDARAGDAPAGGSLPQAHAGWPRAGI
jgi:hypothetical protein